LSILDSMTRVCSLVPASLVTSRKHSSPLAGTTSGTSTNQEAEAGT
ncbi:hypothetical protein BAE44_0013284, partial [Dichanthelium oligosanthes]